MPEYMGVFFAQNSHFFNFGITLYAQLRVLLRVARWPGTA